VLHLLQSPTPAQCALCAFGFAYSDADPGRARETLRRGLLLAQDSGNRTVVSELAGALSRLEARYGGPLAALDYVTVSIRNYHDAGNTIMFRGALAVLATFFDRLGRYEPAATIAGFGVNPLVTATNPEIIAVVAHLREVLGDQTYDSLARKGEAMTTAAMATYAYDQIDQARTELDAVSK
jgi:hypothetical protein